MKENRLFNLIDQIGLDDNFKAQFKDANIKNVVVNPKNDSWEIILELNKEINPYFLKLLENETFKKFHKVTKKVKVTTIKNYQESQIFSDDDFEAKKKKLIDVLSVHSPSLAILNICKLEYKDDKLEIHCSNEVEKEVITSSKSEIIKISNEMNIKINDLEVNINESQNQKIIEKRNNIIQKEISMQSQKQTKIEVIDDIKGEKITALQDVKETKEISVQGYVFNKNIRKVTSKKNGVEYTIIEFDISDDTGFLKASFFAKNHFDETHYNQIKENDYLFLKGSVKKNKFAFDELQLDPIEIKKINKPKVSFNEKERYEISIQTKMSALDGISNINDYIEMANLYNIKGLAITDHDNVQAYPEIEKAFSNNKELKGIYGVKVKVNQDRYDIFRNAQQKINSNIKDNEFVIFDIETTGLSPIYNKIIEIAAIKVKYQDGHFVEIDRYEAFANPGHSLSEFTTELTSITDSMLKGAMSEENLVKEFNEFSKNAILVAHNASFDVDFIDYKNDLYQINTTTKAYFDTLEFSRNVFKDDLKRHNLKALSKLLKVNLEDHHRAIYDTITTKDIFLKMLEILEEKNITKIENINNLINDDTWKENFPSFFSIIVKNQQGLKDLFEFISINHTDNLAKSVPISNISKLKELKDKNNVLIGSSFDDGYVFKMAAEKTNKHLESAISLVDYIEMEPISNLNWMLNHRVDRMDDVRDMYKRIIYFATKQNKIICASSNAYHASDDKYSKIARKILVNTSSFHKLTSKFVSELNFPNASLKKGSDLESEFAFLENKELINNMIYKNPKLIFDMIDPIVIIKKDLFTPKIENSDSKLKNIVYQKAKSIYGENLPKIIDDRLKKELSSIINNGFAVIYLISMDLVKKSLDDGYLVGSRGSVGSSLVATMMEITEVNPLEPHYYCNNCYYSEFFTNGEYACGYDMPDKKCPNCDSYLAKEGQNIPFETFLGFDGDKVPDIDLNFSGDYQAKAHNFTKEIFGEDHVFRAGTISTIQDNTAFGFVKGYESDNHKSFNNSEIQMYKNKISNVKRTTGQHPGGIIVVPSNMSIYDFTPVQFPANKKDSAWKTTHFDFHSIHDNLLKLDILGHDDPTTIKELEKATNTNAKDIKFDDKKVMDLFTKDKAVALPEFGTKFVREILNDTKPKKFSDLVIISGLSHGTDVWNGNAKDLIDNNLATLEEVIGCRDDIMVYLMINGIKPKTAFNIMEDVRKGKGLIKEHEELMLSKNIPSWYIDSCKKIKYMFPKAHATAYVMMAYRIAWYKYYYPLEFYKVYFSIRIDQFDIQAMIKGKDSIISKINEIKDKDKKTKIDTDTIISLEVALDMVKKGFKFEKVNLYKSKSREFIINYKNKSLIPSFATIKGLGDKAAQSVIFARNNLELDEIDIKDLEANEDKYESYKFKNIDDLKKKTKLNKTIIDNMINLGFLDEILEEEENEK